MNKPPTDDRCCGTCRNGYPGTPAESCIRCDDASGWEPITPQDVARLRGTSGVADLLAPPRNTE